MTKIFLKSAIVLTAITGGLLFTNSQQVQATASHSASSVTAKDMTPVFHQTVDASTTFVTGEAAPNTKLSLLIGNKEVGSAQVNSNGSFYVEIKGTIKKGDRILAYTIGSKGASDMYNGSVAATATKLVKPTVDAVKANQLKVTGQGAPGTTIHLVFKGKDEVYSSKVDASGKFTVALDKAYAMGTLFTAFVTNGQGQTSPSAISAVQGGAVSMAAPVMAVLDSSQKVINGQAQAGTTAHVFVANDEYTGTVGQDGKFSLSMNKNYPTGTTIKAYVVNQQGEKSKEYTGTVAKKVVSSGPTVNPVKAADKVMTGTAGPMANVQIVINNTTTIVVADQQGNWSYNVDKGFTYGTTYVVLSEENGVYSSVITGMVQH